jgi:hypothetical protein
VVRRQLAAEIAKRVAVDHMAGPDVAQPAAAPAMSARSFLADAARWQLSARAQFGDGIDEGFYLMQTRAAGEFG